MVLLGLRSAEPRSSRRGAGVGQDDLSPGGDPAAAARTRDCDAVAASRSLVVLGDLQLVAQPRPGA
jgi:hypothetical protein